MTYPSKAESCGSSSCGYSWEDPDYETNYQDECGGFHECILQSDDGHTEHECACSETQSEEL